jgi:hypothetical protein
MTIIFYNNFNNGDVHFSRGIIETIVKIFPNCKYYYLHKNKKGLLKDITYLVESELDENCDMEQSVLFLNDKIYINTWYGQNYRKFLNLGGTTLLTVKLILENILSILNIQTLINKENLLPNIYYENINKPKIDDGFNVLICNNNAISGQANNVNLNETINFLSENNPNINFYVTEKIDLVKTNIIYTSDITESFPDLVDISYISTKCKLVVGRSSGPYSFSLTKTNLLDENKSFFALCHDYNTGIWCQDIIKCKYYHEPSNDINKITQSLQNIISNYVV